MCLIFGIQSINLSVAFFHGSGDRFKHAVICNMRSCPVNFQCFQNKHSGYNPCELRANITQTQLHQVYWDFLKFRPRCNQCLKSKQYTLEFCLLCVPDASLVLRRGKHTCFIRLCQLCFNESRKDVCCSCVSTNTASSHANTHTHKHTISLWYSHKDENNKFTLMHTHNDL